MKTIILLFLSALLLTLSGCFTAATLSGIKTEGRQPFQPDSVWLSKDGKTVAFQGHSGDKTCHVLVPRKALNDIRKDDNTVTLSDLSKLSMSGGVDLRITEGPVSRRFDKTGDIGKGGDPVFLKAPSVHPERALFLPITIVADVVTLPAQIPLMHGLSKIH